jgi:hypothetical protein
MPLQVTAVAAVRVPHQPKQLAIAQLQPQLAAVAAVAAVAPVEAAVAAVQAVAQHQRQR